MVRVDVGALEWSNFYEERDMEALKDYLYIPFIHFDPDINQTVELVLNNLNTVYTDEKSGPKSALKMGGNTRARAICQHQLL